jgi:CRISPR-associated protein Cas1
LPKAAISRAPHKISLNKLRDIEGQAASVYFDGFARMLRRGQPFNKRSRRPPTDPVNALLSFGYALLYNEAVAALVAVGFDAYLGLYHQTRYGRVSLALDLMEEMRSLVVDRLALSLINREIFKVDDFQKDDDGGIRLQEESRKRFLREYERAISTEFTERLMSASTVQRKPLARAMTIC